MAVEIINQLFSKHQISIITARPLCFRDVTTEWLGHHKVSYHNISFTEDKLQECMNSRVDVLIDDAPHYAIEFALNKRPVILFEQPYNISIDKDLIYRATNWKEVKMNIENLEFIIK